MEIYRSCLCPDCNSEVKIYNGDYLFSYNIECLNGHKQSNIDLDLILEKRRAKHNLFKCKSHRKKIILHCFTCNEDICPICYSDIHKTHKIEYFKKLTLDSRGKYDIEYNSNKVKEILQIFLTELNNFQSKINLYIDTFKTQLRKQYDFRTELINNIIGNNNSYIDIENYKTHSNSEAYKKIDEYINKFINKVTFLQKYDCLKVIYEELIKKSKYIEEKKIISRINDYINLNLLPLNDNLFMQCKKNYMANTSEITIFKENFEKKTNKCIYEPITTQSFPFIINKGPILIDNFNKNEHKSEFYNIANNSVIKMTILNEVKDNDKDNCIINIVNVDKIRALVNLSENKNVVFDSDGIIYLYNDSFKEEKLLGKNPRTFSIVDNSLKINEKSFVYTLKNDQKINTVIYNMNVDNNNDIEILQIKTNGLTPMPFSYMKNKDILLSLCYKYKYNNIKENNYYCIYLINFKTQIPEIFQIININYYEMSKKILYFNCFNDESFYFPISQNTYKNEMFYNVIYISQYKLIKGEFIEVSRIKKEDDFSLKRFNSYGS
jgi:hypothetical protein